MRIAETIPTPVYTGFALLAALVLAGCATGDKSGAKPSCPPTCVVTITVPADPAASPRVDIEKLRLRARHTLEFDVKLEEGVDPGSVDLEVRFEEALFELPSGTPAKSLPVKAGKNAFRSRPFSYRYCPAPGCKYDVVDKGPGGRPPLDPWIIIER
jgi:hypothetical protein